MDTTNKQVAIPKDGDLWYKKYSFRLIRIPRHFSRQVRHWIRLRG